MTSNKLENLLHLVSWFVEIIGGCLLNLASSLRHNLIERERQIKMHTSKNCPLCIFLRGNSETWMQRMSRGPLVFIMYNTVGELCESSGGFGALILIFEVVGVYLKGMERFKIGFWYNAECSSFCLIKAAFCLCINCRFITELWPDCILCSLIRVSVIPNTLLFERY